MDDVELQVCVVELRFSLEMGEDFVVRPLGWSS